MKENIDFNKLHEWDLVITHKKALAKEDYETCLSIQKEIDIRIENDTIDHVLMEGFRYYNPVTKEFEGNPKYDGLNGLFKNYKI